MMSPIHFKNVCKSFRKEQAVTDLTLEIPAGQVTAFLGSNGAGKTTTIKMALGLLPQSSGEITICGTDSRKLKPVDFQKIAYVSENQKLPLWMTVKQFLNFCRPLYSTWDTALETQLQKQFDLPLDRKLKSLSRGQLMKASLLSNLAFRPELIVLDEPFSGLDPLVRDELIGGLLELSESESWTVFVSSHDIEEVSRLVDHIAIIDRGRLQIDESSESLLGRFRKIMVPLVEGSAPPAKVPEDWLEPQRSGRFFNFIHSQWSDESAPEITGILGPLTDGPLSSDPLSLREIFVVLAKKYRLQS